MTKSEINVLIQMHERGKTGREIADTLRLSLNTVRSYIRRHPMQQAETALCRYCGKSVTHTKGHKAKIFCSDKCRNAWWREHPELIKREAFYTLVCYECGKEFVSYGNKDRKYCSRACYGESRRCNKV